MFSWLSSNLIWFNNKWVDFRLDNLDLVQSSIGYIKSQSYNWNYIYKWLISEEKYENGLSIRS